MTKYRGVRIQTDYDHESVLDKKSVVDYEYFQKKLIDWFLDAGKDPENGEGYSKSTVEPAMYRIDRFFRFIWNSSETGYTTWPTQDQATEYLKYIAIQEYENSYKKGIEKALKMLFKYQHHVRETPEWDCKLEFKVSSNNPPEEYLTEMELVALRRVAHDYGSIPSYSNLSPLDRDRWKSYLAQQFGIPKTEVDKNDWEKANTWKFSSLVCTAIDAGLRPNEIENATLDWLDLENNVLQIPKADGGTDEWIVSIREETARALKKWVEERQHYEKYDDTDLLWLTRRQNPYQSNSLNYLLENLCDEAGIESDDRQISWLTLRDSVGKHMADAGDIELVREQLRHESCYTERRYGSDVEKRRKILERI